MTIFDSPITTNDHSIDRVLAAGLPIAIVFLDSKVPTDLDQAMNRNAREYAGDLLVVKIEAKENPDTIRRYNILRTPAVVTVREIQVLSQAEPISGSELDRHIAYLLGKGPRPKTPSRVDPEAQPYSTTTNSNGHPITVSDATFDQEIMNASQVVLVDFWAPWCGPCRMTEPIIEKLAREMSGRWKVAKVNVDENPYTAQKYGIQSIPTMMIVKNGQILDRWAGALPETALRSRLMAKI